MSVRAFTLDSGNNLYSEMYGKSYYTSDGITGTRATRNATVSNQKILARNIAASHNSELRNAYEYLEEGNISAFQSVINEIKSNESAKQRTYNISDSEIESAIESAYEQVVGADYDTSLTAKKQGSFESGFKQNFFGGIFYGDCKSAAEYTAERRGTEVNSDEQAKKNGGKAIGAITTIGASAAGIAGVCKLFATGTMGVIGNALVASMAAHPVGWLVGLGIVALTAFSAITKK